MQRIEYRLRSDFIELNHLLKLSGLCSSGGAGKALVASGAVSVDGIQELRKTCKIRAGQVVALGDVSIKVLEAEPHSPHGGR
jgi:ribosome-associated protein